MVLFPSSQVIYISTQLYSNMLIPINALMQSKVQKAIPLEPLRCHHLKDRTPRLQPQLLPAVKMRRDIDRASRAMGPTDRPQLVKVRGTIDLRHITVGQHVDIIHAIISVHLAEDVAVTRGARAVRLDNVPLGDGVGGPSVDSEGVVAFSGEVAVPGEGAAEVR